MLVWAQITDLHIDNQDPELTHIDARANALAALEAIRKENIDRLIITGDMAESSRGTDWFLEQVAQRKFEYEFIPGNHDTILSVARENGPAETQTYYARQFEGFLVLFLDSANYSVDNEQLAWLDEQLAKTRKDVLIFIHHPVLDCGNSLADQKFPLKNREAVLRILLKASSKITLFCGHYHREETVKHGNVTQYLTPSTLYQIKKYSSKVEVESEAIGYRILTINNGTYTTQVKYLERPRKH